RADAGGPSSTEGCRHGDERPRDPERRGHPGSVAQRRVRVQCPSQGHGPLGLGLVALAAGLPAQIVVTRRISMEERALRTLIDQVRAGILSRRRFVKVMVGLGLTAPMAAQMLASTGVAQAQTKWTFSPTKRGGGGLVKTLWWQAPTLLNPHFATGTKDQDASRIFYEPLGAYDPDGNIVPMLAAEVPSQQNGQVAKDGMSVTWRLRKNVVWHDGKPFTADDVVFNWEYVTDPATAAVSSGNYRDIARIDKLDSHTVKLVFKSPTPFWSSPFCGPYGMIIPSTSSRRTRATSRARPRTTSSPSAPGRSASRTS